jgi:hypothetical protein
MLRLLEWYAEKREVSGADSWHIATHHAKRRAVFPCAVRSDKVRVRFKLRAGVIFEGAREHNAYARLCS